MKDVIHKFMEWWKVNFIVVGFAVLIFLLLLSDRLLFVSDIFSFNLNGWIGLIHDFIPLFCLMLAPLFLLGSYAKWFYMPFLTLEIVLLPIGWFVRINFKMVLDGTWVGIVLGSSPDETIWFIKHYASVSMALFALMLIVLIVGSLKLSALACMLRVTRTTVVMGVAGILVFFYANQVLDVLVYRELGKVEGIKRQVFSVRLLFDSFQHWNHFRLLASVRKNPRIPSTIEAESGLSDDVVGVFVLGESAARSHWELYGYERATTPCMNLRKNELVIFEDLVTPVGATAEAMRYMFTTRTIEHPLELQFTMAQCLKYAGYDVAMFTNQGRWGALVGDGDETFDFAGCDPFVFMNEHGETNPYDEVLLPYCTNYLAKASKKTIAFLHFHGSHLPQSNCYPHDGAPFKPEHLQYSSDASNPTMNRNHYDNSIWYTDKILGRIIEELESLHKPAWMVYVSDHGETPSAKGWRVQTDNDLWEIPFIVWTSNEFRERFPDKIKALSNAAKLPLQSDQLLYGLLNFCGVKGLGNRPDEDFLDQSFKCRKRRMVQNGRVEYMPKLGEVENGTKPTAIP